jgi:hypothetical protein
MSFLYPVSDTRTVVSCSPANRGLTKDPRQHSGQAAATSSKVYGSALLLPSGDFHRRGFVIAELVGDGERERERAVSGCTLSKNFRETAARGHAANLAN